MTYLDVAERVRRRFRGGAPGSDRFLPSTRTLAEEWGLSANQINRAYLHLVAEGFLERVGRRLRLAQGAARHGPGPTLPFPIDVVCPEALDRRGHEAFGRKAGCQMRFHFFGPGFNPRVRLQDVREKGARAVVAWSFGADAHGILRELSDRGVIVVTCERVVPGIDSVASSGAEDIARTVWAMGQRGHREVVLIGMERDPSILQHWLDEGARMASGGGVVVHQWSASSGVGAGEAVAEWMAAHPRVTGVICRNRLLGAAARLFVKERNGRQERARALIVLGDETMPGQTPFPVAAFKPQHPMIGWLASELVVARHAMHGELPVGPQRIQVSLRLTEPGEVAAEVSPVASAGSIVDRPTRWPSELSARKEAALATWQAPRDGTPWARWAAKAVPLTLRELANAGTSGRHGWMGTEPIRHLPRGVRMVHGLPFDLVEDRDNGGRGMLLFRSLSLPRRRALLARTAIAIGRRIRAVFVLQICGHGRSTEAFGCYRVVSEAGQTVAEVPLIPLGERPAEAAPEATIQDWWHDFPWLESDRVRPVVLTEEGDPLRYERRLYILRIDIPVAARKALVSHLDVDVRADAVPVLGILAVTVIPDE